MYFITINIHFLQEHILEHYS